MWDTAYFARVARCGYETDKSFAFFPALPAAMRGLAAAAAAATGTRMHCRLATSGCYSRCGFPPSHL